MAQPAEPMDTDLSDFDNKENSLQRSNVLTHSTEKGYEELDVSELNMRLRYSLTPVSSPITKSCTHTQVPADINSTVTVSDVCNLDHLLGSTTAHNNATKTPKSLPLQSLPLASTITLGKENNVTVTVTNTDDIQENVSIPSSSSSLTDTPEPTTPVSEAPKPSGSPILRGIKSVLNMFRSSPSPIPSDDRLAEDEVSSPPVVISPVSSEDIDPRPESWSSTPLSTNRKDGNKRNSPLKESLVFQDDLEKELAWREETTILFSKEKIPVHKLFFQQPKLPSSDNEQIPINNEVTMDSSMEPMDISYNNSTLKNITMADSQHNNIYEVNEEDITIGNTEKEDTVFLDCETTFSMDIPEEMDPTKEYTENELLDSRTNLDASLLSQVINQNETNMSMFSAEFQPELEKINAFKDNIQVTEKGGVLIEDDLVPLLKNLDDHMPTSVLPHEMIKVITNNEQDRDCSVKNKVEDESLDIGEVPENIQKTLEDTLYRMDGTHCFDDTIDVISRLEAAIRQQDDEFMEAPSNLKKENFDTTLENLVHNISSKDTTQASNESVNITLKDSDAVDPSKLDDTFIADNVTLPNKSHDNQDENNVTLAGIQTDITDVQPVSTDITKTLPILEDVVNKSEGHFTTNIACNSVSQSVFASSCKDELTKHDLAEPLFDIKLPTEIAAQETPVINITLTEVPNTSESGAIYTTVFSETKGINIEDSSIPGDHNKESLVDQIEEEKEKYTAIVNKSEESEKDIFQQDITQNNYVQCQPQSFTILEPVIQQKEQSITNSTNSARASEIMQSKDTMHQECKQHEDQEIFISESNSPFVSLSTEDEDLSDAKKLDNEPMEPYPVNTDNQLVPQAKVEMSPPLSPRLPGKSSYNFNFDEMDDPFAMKSKVQASLTSDVSDKTIDIIDAAAVLNNADNQVNTTMNLNTATDYMQKADTTVNLDTSFPQVPLNNELQQNITTEIATLKTDLTFDFDNLNMTNRVNEDWSEICKSSVLTDIPSKIVDQTLIATETVIIKVDNVGIEKTENNISKLDEDVPPPSSPSLPGKGAYNFNFDEMDDPFGSETKTKILSSPDVLNKTLDAISKAHTSINKTSGKLSVKSPGVIQNESMAFNTDKTQITTDVKTQIVDANDETYEETKYDISEKEQESLDDFAMEENKISVELAGIFSQTTEAMSSSEQSTYASAGTLSNEGGEEKLAEYLDDIDNRHASNSNVRSLEAKFISGNKITTQNRANDNFVEDNLPEFGDNDGTVTNCSGSSKATDEKDETIKEVLTEDEDTVEGPFIESQLSVDSEKVTLLPAKTALFTEVDQFTELLAEPNKENFEVGEMFIDADAFQFLMNQNKSNNLDENGKESLFLKFDPLFAKRVNSDGVVEALTKLHKRQSTPKKIKPVTRDLMCLDKSPVAGPSNIEISLHESHEDVNVTVSQKPTMAVPPAVNPVPTPRQKATTPTRVNRLSMNFTSPAMAVIDRLLSMSANNSMVDQDTSQISREHIEADRALTQFRELLAEKEVNVHHLRCENKDLKNRLAAIELQVSSLECESEKRLKNIEELNKKLDERDQMNKNMASVVEEYERTIGGLIAGIEEDKKSHAHERIQLIRDRDEQSAHLSSMEAAFNDLHSKYEKSKQIIFSYKAKEDIYRKSIKEFEDNLSKMEKNYESLKQHATSKLNFANQELEKINKSHESEVVKLTAMMKRKDLHISSLEETLAQKSKANEELTAICDELINKVG